MSNQSTQSYANHAQFVPMFHFVLCGLIVVLLIGSGVNLYQSLGDHQRLYSASLIFVMMIAMALMFVFVRAFPMKVQDRAIRAEENLRHFAMTGKLLDPALTMSQILALRFASDAEFVALAQRAVKERLSSKDIKQSVKNWRADFYRA